MISSLRPVVTPDDRYGMSKYWAGVVPAVLGGILFYAYRSPNYIGHFVRGIVDPILQPIFDFLRTIFPI